MFLFIIAVVGMVGASRHHQVCLFFVSLYMCVFSVTILFQSCNLTGASNNATYVLMLNKCFFLSQCLIRLKCLNFTLFCRNDSHGVVMSLLLPLIFTVYDISFSDILAAIFLLVCAARG